MRSILLLLLPAALFAGQARYARLGEFEGKVEVQLHAGDPWSAAERNLPLVESAWLRTGASSRLEIELDEGSAWRLGPDSQVEISDYTRLSTGQRVTVLSLDRGVAYLTGEPGGTDTLTLVVPGGQVTLLHGARVRLEVEASVSRISIIEGAARLYCPAAELDIREGQTVRLEPANTARFALDREVPAMPLDGWNEERDKTLAAASSATHVAQRYGAADLDGTGVWVQTDEGAVWKPKVAEGWAPYQSGRWRWYDGLGYTWVSDEAWGWTPYHYGRWRRKGDLGWVWFPASGVFKPGDVYWLYNAKLAGWGPLAPGEEWQPSVAPEQFLNVNTTYANFRQGARAIDPAGFQDRPKEPLGVAVLAVALPSPAFPASRLEAIRPVRVGAKSVQVVVPGTAFGDTGTDRVEAPPQAPPAVVTNPATDEPPVLTPGPPPDPDPGPPGPPMQVIYPVPVYTGIVVVNPPEHPPYARQNPNWPGAKTTTAAPAPAATPTPAPPARTSRTVSPVPEPIPHRRPTSPPGDGDAPRVTKREAPPVEVRRPSPIAPPVDRDGPRVTRREAPTVEAKPAEVRRPSPIAPPVDRDGPRVTRREAPPAKAETKPEVKADSAPAKKQ